MNTHTIYVSRDNGKRHRYSGHKEVIAWENHFNVELNTFITAEKAMEVAEDIKKRFPAEDGFKVELEQWTVPVGHKIEMVEE